jgi:hypothetical protein
LPSAAKSNRSQNNAVLINKFFAKPGGIYAQYQLKKNEL